MIIFNNYHSEEYFMYFIANLLYLFLDPTLNLKKRIENALKVQTAFVNGGKIGWLVDIKKWNENTKRMRGLKGSRLKKNVNEDSSSEETTDEETTNEDTTDEDTADEDTADEDSIMDERE